MEGRIDLNILIVDCGSNLKDITQQLMLEKQYAIRSITSLSDCLPSIYHTKTDLILLDIPESYNAVVDLCSVIKNDPAVSSISILLCSELELNSEQIAQTLEAGADGYLKLPMSRRELLARVGAASRTIHTDLRAKALIENAPDGVVLIGMNGNFLYASPSAIRMFGYSPEDLSFYKAEDPTHPDDLPIIYETIGKILENPALVLTIQYRFRHINGEYFWIESTFSNMFNMPGVEAIVINFRNITERKLAEEELKQAKEKAEESDRLKSAFLANMSHEIRTPMNAIVGFASMLSEPDLSENDRQRYSNIIQSRSDDLMHLINDLLDISRIESGNATVIKENVNLNTIVDEMEIIFQQRLQKLQKTSINLTPIKSLFNEESILYTDGYIIKQVFSNLIDNAIKYTHSGSIMFGYFPIEDGNITCFVADTGMGITKENQSIIFEHFRQGESADRYSNSGTGLGLSICKGLLALLEGDIKVESEPGKGSTFSFTLPFRVMPGKVQSSKIKIEKHLETESYNWPDKKILIVEDDPMNMEYFKIVLNPTHVKLVSVYTAKELKQMYELLNTFDLVLLDVRLPDAIGWDLAKEIKQICPELPVISQTAHAMSSDRKKSEEAGCDAYISKPIRKEKFLDLIAEFIMN